MKYSKITSRTYVFSSANVLISLGQKKNYGTMYKKMEKLPK